MKAGSFTLNSYLEKLHENAEGGSLPTEQVEGMLLPDENKASFGWLKKEYDKAKTEVKVEIKMGGSKFEPGYELETDLDSVKDFKPGMFGEIKTSDTPGAKKEKGEAKKETPKVGEEDESSTEKKAEKSTGSEAPKKGGGVSAKVKTTDDADAGKDVVKKGEGDADKDEDADKKKKEDAFKKMK